MKNFDVIIIGAGAAGLMCAARAGQRGRRVLLLEHGDKIGAKILISGGGRCNFTNRESTPDRFLSQNPHFCKSALKSYTQHDFIALVEKHRIAYHEKTLGQLFCDHAAQNIVTMLVDECQMGEREDQPQSIGNYCHQSRHVWCANARRSGAGSGFGAGDRWAVDPQNGCDRIYASDRQTVSYSAYRNTPRFGAADFSGRGTRFRARAQRRQS